MNSPLVQVTPPSPKCDSLDKALAAAMRSHRAGDDAGAEQLYLTILQRSPGHALASYGVGLLLASLHRFPEAVHHYRQAIETRPDFTDAFINLGTVFLTLGRHEEALELYHRAIEISPENAMAHGNLGKALQDLGRTDAAIEAYRAAIALEPRDAISHANLGAVLLEQQAWGDAEAITRRAIALAPESAMAYANLGTAMMHLGRHDEALAACRQAMALQPQGVAIHASLGGAMLELGALPEAIDLCRQAIALDPGLASAHFNLSHALKLMNLLEEATLSARQAIALCPGWAEYHFHLAHLLLTLGDLTGGWEEYEWRWKLPDFAGVRRMHGAFSQPRWNGEDIRDKILLIYTEQGLGDIILFARYLPLAVHRAARVVVATTPPLCRLLRSVDGITIVSLQDVPLPDFDVQCPLISLPRAFATRLENIPTDVPYFAADAGEMARWRARIGGGALKVGIVWAGNPATKRDRFRSPGLTNVAPLFAVPGVDFVVLQVGAGRGDMDVNPLPSHVLDLGCEVADLDDTAAIISGLDLMISSCTAPLHLAGALGVRTWAMIPFAPYFPWLLARTDSPWYPTMRLYRQEQAGMDWSGVVGRMAADLSDLVACGPGAVQSPRIFLVDEQRESMAVDRDVHRETEIYTMNEIISPRAGGGPTSLQENASERESYPTASDVVIAQPDIADVLHVGCGVQAPGKLPPVFNGGRWREIRLDIDPEVRPDHIASITDMSVISDGAVDAVYSSHNIEHLYPHEVPLALREMRRVLKMSGFAFIKLPDLQEVARHVAEGRLESPLYLSPMGPIAPLDILYGHRPSMARGNLFMAHRTGFTSETLGAALISAGFAVVMVQRDLSAFCLDAIAFRVRPGVDELARAQARMLPAPDRPAVLYAPAA